MIKQLHHLTLLIFSYFILSGAVFAADNKPLNIVTTIHPLKLIIAEITGEDSTVTTLVANNSSAHHYHLKPSHMQALEQADLIVWVGPSLENFMTKVINNLEKQQKTIITIEKNTGIELLEYRADKLWNTDEHHDHHGHNHGHHHDHTSYDGHVWLSPKHALTIAEQIAQQLSVASPSQKPVYEKNLYNFKEKIQKLDAMLLANFAMHKTTPYLVYHDAFQYFEHHIGLNSKGSFITDSSQSLSGKRLRLINKVIKEEKIKCIFADKQYDLSVPQKVAKQAGINIQALDPLGYENSYAEGGYVRLLETISQNMLSCFDR